MRRDHTLQGRRTVLKRLGTATVVGGLTGVGASGTAAASLTVSEISSDPRVQAIEQDIGSLSFGEAQTTTADVNYYQDVDDDIDIVQTNVGTDNGTLRYGRGYVNGSLQRTEAVLTDFSHWNYTSGDIGDFTTSLEGYSDGTTYFSRTATQTELNDADDALDHGEVVGHTEDDLDTNLYPAWDGDDDDVTLYDSGDVSGGGGGGGSDPIVNGTGDDQVTQQSCDPMTTLWSTIAGAAASFGLTLVLLWNPAGWVIGLKSALGWGSVAWTILDCTGLV